MVNSGYVESHRQLLIRSFEAAGEASVLVNLEDQDETGMSYSYRWNIRQMNSFLTRNQMANYMALEGKKVIGNVRKGHGEKIVTGIAALCTQASL